MILVSRAFRMAITCAVGLAIMSTIALIVVLVRHQKTIRQATREMEFQRMRSSPSTPPYSDLESRQVEMNIVKSDGRTVVKYDKVPLQP